VYRLTSGSSPHVTWNSSRVVRCVWDEYEEVVSACVSSKILRLYATPQDIVITPGAQEPPRRGKG